MTSEETSRRRRRWPWLALALLLAVGAARVTLPGMVRDRLASTLSEQLGRAVSVGNVRLGLLRGRVGLDDVAIRPVNGDAPQLSIRRLDARIGWLALMERRVHVADVSLLDPALSTERLATGDFVVPAFLGPAAHPEEAPAPAETVPDADGPEAPAVDDATAEPDAPTWTVVIDRLSVTDAQLSFLDHAVAAEGLSLRLPRLEARDITIGTRGAPTLVRLRGRLDEGDVDMHVTLVDGDDGVALTIDTTVTHLPLERATPYARGLGWAVITGTLDATGRYVSTPGDERTLAGTLTVRDLTIRVPDLEGPAARAGVVTIPVDSVDFSTRDVRIGPIVLEGPTLVARPEAPVILPLLPRSIETDEEAEDAGAPWTWTIAKVTVTGGTAELERGGTRIPISVAGSAGQLPGGTDGVPVTVTATHAGITIDGSGRITTDPFGLHADLQTSDAPLGELLTLAGSTTPAMSAGGTVSATIGLDVGAATADDAVLSAGGTVVLAEPAVSGAADAFRARAATVSADVEHVRLPGDGSPPQVAISRLAIAAPSVRLTRTADGLVLPTDDGPDPPDRPSEADTPGHGAPPALVIADLAIDDGRIEVIDKTLRPPFNEEFRDVAFRAARVRWPDLRIGEFTAHTRTPRRGAIDAAGWVRRAETKLDIEMRDVAIAPYNGHLAQWDRRVGERSRTTVTSRIRLEPTRYRSRNRVVLGDFSLTTARGDMIVVEQVGMPLPAALSLLRDPKGNVVLNVPIEGERSGTRVPLAPVIGSALRQALVGALASPLKMLTGILPEGASEAALPHVPYRAGTAELHPDADSAIATIAMLLTDAPGLRVRLHPSVGQRDRRALARAELRPRLEAPEPTGLVAEVDAEQRVRLAAFLAARRAGQDATLDEVDRATLTRLTDAVAVPPETERSLAAARIAHLRTLLEREHGVAETQLIDHRVDRPGAGAPGVEVELFVEE